MRRSELAVVRHWLWASVEDKPHWIHCAGQGPPSEHSRRRCRRFSLSESTIHETEVTALLLLHHFPSSRRRPFSSNASARWYSSSVISSRANLYARVCSGVSTGGGGGCGDRVTDRKRTTTAAMINTQNAIMPTAMRPHPHPLMWPPYQNIIASTSSHGVALSSRMAPEGVSATGSKSRSARGYCGGDDAPHTLERSREMSSTAAVSRTPPLVVLSVMGVAGLIAMHGLANSGGMSACFGDPRLPASDVQAADPPQTTAVALASVHRADPAASPAPSPGAHTAPAPADASMSAACVATVPRLMGVPNPLLIGLLVLVALCVAVACGNTGGLGRWRQWRPPPASGVELLHLKCVLRT